MPVEHITATELAARLGVGVQTIPDYVARGMPVADVTESGRKRYDPVECLEWQKREGLGKWRLGKGGDYRSKSYQESKEEDGGDEEKGTYNAAKIRKMLADAEVAEMKVQQTTGALVLRVDVERVWTQAVRLLGSRLDEACGRLATDLLGTLGISDAERRIEVEKIIRKELDGAREEMARMGVVEENDP